MIVRHFGALVVQERLRLLSWKGRISSRREGVVHTLVEPIARHNTQEWRLVIAVDAHEPSAKLVKALSAGPSQAGYHFIAWSNLEMSAVLFHMGQNRGRSAVFDHGVKTTPASLQKNLRRGTFGIVKLIAQAHHDAHWMHSNLALHGDFARLTI